MESHNRNFHLHIPLFQEFTAIHRIKICPVDRTIFRSDELDKIVPPRCTYSNDMNDLIENYYSYYEEVKRDPEFLIYLIEYIFNGFL